MPEKKTRAAAAKDKLEGKSASTQAGEYVHEEIEHARKSKHGVKNTEQAIAIGLAKARRDGVKLKPKKNASMSTKIKNAADHGHSGVHTPSQKRSAGAKKALNSPNKKATEKETVGKEALSSHARKAANKRTASSRSAAAKNPQKRTEKPAARVRPRKQRGLVKISKRPRREIFTRSPRGRHQA